MTIKNEIKSISGTIEEGLNKSRTLNSIKKGSKKIKYSFLEGFYEGDGCLSFDKRLRYAYQPRLNFSILSKSLSNDIINLLKDLKIVTFHFFLFLILLIQKNLMIIII